MYREKSIHCDATLNFEIFDLNFQNRICHARAYSYRSWLLYFLFFRGVLATLLFIRFYFRSYLSTKEQEKKIVRDDTFRLVRGQHWQNFPTAYDRALHGRPCESTRFWLAQLLHGSFYPNSPATVTNCFGPRENAIGSTNTHDLNSQFNFKRLYGVSP